MEVRGLTEWPQLSGVEHGVTSSQFSQFVERGGTVVGTVTAMTFFTHVHCRTCICTAEQSGPGGL